MQNLLAGIHHFQSKLFPARRQFFERLAEGQSPTALFVTCSDSRINPNLLTQTDPGELFILRNAGNIVPPYGASNGGEGATIEFAVAGLGIRDIVICGHSHCGAMKGVVNPDSCREMPLVAAWLNHAEATRRIVRDKYRPQELSDDQLLSAAVQENVLVQLENLRTHPSVAAGLSQEQLRLHGWVYKLETGELFVFHPSDGQFVRLTEHSLPVDQRHAVLTSI